MPQFVMNNDKMPFDQYVEMLRRSADTNREGAEWMYAELDDDRIFGGIESHRVSFFYTYVKRRDIKTKKTVALFFFFS